MPSILYHIVEGFINYCLLKFGVDSPCGYWVMAKSRWYYCRRKAPWCVGVVCCQKSVDVEVPERVITSKLGKLTSAIVVSQNVAHRTTKSWCDVWWSDHNIGSGDRRQSTKQFAIIRRAWRRRKDGWSMPWREHRCWRWIVNAISYPMKRII